MVLPRASWTSTMALLSCTATTALMVSLFVALRIETFTLNEALAQLKGVSLPDYFKGQSGFLTKTKINEKNLFK